MPVSEKLVAPVPFSVQLTVPVRAPAAVGLNVTVIAHVPLTASADEQVFVWAKSVEPELTAIPERVTGEVPLFVTVTDCEVALFPTCIAA